MFVVGTRLFSYFHYQEEGCSNYSIDREIETIWNRFMVFVCIVFGVKTCIFNKEKKEFVVLVQDKETKLDHPFLKTK